MLTQEQRDRIQELLLREREGALRALRSFDQSSANVEDRTGELSMYRFHPADIGTETMEQEKKFLLASNEGRLLYEIDDALQRLYKNPERFGTCERGGEQISMERLEVIPHARFCAVCQRQVEEGGEATE